ncbi:MAG: PIN domain-containing protein [Chloroflexota bacterium]
MLRAVIIDTNIVFEGLTHRNSPCAFILQAWSKQRFISCVSVALQYEYFDVLSRKLLAKRWDRVKPLLGTLLRRAGRTTIRYTWRPSSPDPAEEFVIDCAMNANARVVARS